MYFKKISVRFLFFKMSMSHSTLYYFHTSCGGVLVENRHKASKVIIDTVTLLTAVNDKPNKQQDLFCNLQLGISVLNLVYYLSGNYFT